VEAAGNQNISQTVDEQGYLLRYHDQLAQLETAMEEVHRSVQHLKHTREALPSTSKGYSTTSRPSEPAHQLIQQPAQVSDARLSLLVKYDGTSSKYIGLLLQFSLYFSLPWLFLCLLGECWNGPWLLGESRGGAGFI
jgi:hypothetical protein